MIESTAPYQVSSPPASADDVPFVFHDAAGRRWSRIKRVALVVGAVLAVLCGAVVVAITQVAPGRAPAFSVPIPQQVPDWPLRKSGAAPAPSVVAGPAARPVAAPQPTATTAASPASPSALKPAASPSAAHTPRPKRTRSSTLA